MANGVWDPQHSEAHTNIFIVVANQQGHTEVLRYDIFVSGLFKQMVPDMMKCHAGLGICTEAGEIADIIKANVMYGKKLTPEMRDHMILEMGDLEFFLQAARNLYGISHQEVFQGNANKLADRYKGLMYSDAAAIARVDKKNSGEPDKAGEQ